jgi:hypothetical protein
MVAHPRLLDRLLPADAARVGALATFLVEAYEPHRRAATLSELEARVRAAADDLSSAGTAVRFVRSFFVPEDETCFYVFEAASADAVRAASDRAHLSAHRIVQAVEPDRSPGPSVRT